MIYTVKGFSLVNEAKGFLELPCFPHALKNVGSLISCSCTSSKPSLCIWMFSVHVLLKPILKDFHHNLASMWNELTSTVVWTLFCIFLLWDWNENWLFPALWPLLSFPNLLTYLAQYFNSIIFKILSSSAGIPSPAIALFIVMLPKVYLTMHSRMSGSRWVTTLLWLSESLRLFLYSSLVYSCHFFSISFASIRSLRFCPLSCPSLHETFP